VWIIDIFFASIRLLMCDIAVSVANLLWE